MRILCVIFVLLFFVIGCASQSEFGDYLYIDKEKLIDECINFIVQQKQTKKDELEFESIEFCLFEDAEYETYLVVNFKVKNRFSEVVQKVEEVDAQTLLIKEYYESYQVFITKDTITGKLKYECGKVPSNIPQSNLLLELKD